MTALFKTKAVSDYRKLLFRRYDDRYLIRSLTLFLGFGYRFPGFRVDEYYIYWTSHTVFKVINSVLFLFGGHVYILFLSINIPHLI